MPPAMMEVLAGVTVMEVSTGCVTVSNVEPLTAFSAARIVVAPRATPVASPEPLIVAAPVFEEDHVTTLERSEVLPSE